MRGLTDEQLAALTPEFRQRLANGERLDDLLPEAFAACREAGLPHQEHAAFRRANARRRRAAPRQHRRNGHRRRQNARRHAAGLPQRPGTEGRSRRHRQRLPGPPRLRMDDADLQDARRLGRLHPERHGTRRPPQGLRLRHHLRHQQRIRLRLPARQHEAGPLGRRRVRPALPPVPEGAQLRHHRRGGQHPHRRGAHAAHHQRPGLQRPPPLHQGQRHRRAAQRPAEGTPGQVFRDQGKGTHLPPDRRGHPQGRGAGRRRELLHGRQHGMAAPHRQRPQSASPLQKGQKICGDAPSRDERAEHHHHRRVHRPSDDRPAVVRRPAPGGRGQARQGRREDQGGDADAGHGHAAKLLQAVQEAGGHDRHGPDRGRRVLEDLQPRSHLHSDQQAAGPRQPPRHDLPHREGEVEGGRGGGRGGPQGGPADPDRHDRRGQVAEAERAAQAPRHQA